MGLGPPVCDICDVIPIWAADEWKCPVCGSTTFTRHAGITSDWDRYEDNLKFLKFVKGESNGD